MKHTISLIIAIIGIGLLATGCGAIKQLAGSGHEEPVLMDGEAKLGQITVYSESREEEDGKNEIRFLVSSYAPNGSKGVTWSVSGNQKESTSIDQDGVLTIAKDESAAELIVSATSNDDPALVSYLKVQFKAPEPEPETETETKKEKETEPETTQPSTEPVTQPPAEEVPVIIWTPPVYYPPEPVQPEPAPAPTVPGNDGVTIIG